MNLSCLSRYIGHKMRTRKIFNFLGMLIEIDVFIRKFIKRIEIILQSGLKSL